MRLISLLAIACFAAACTTTIGGGPDPIGGGGGSSGGGGGGEGPDASTGGGGSPDAAPVVSPDAPAVACKTKVTTNLGNGHHNAGLDCQQGCHNHGFTLSGTMYAGVNSTTPVAGATITVTDSANKTFDVITQSDGNFYTSNTVTFPVHVVASSCPDTVPMVSTVAANGGGCNSCHAAGASGKIHLP